MPAGWSKEFGQTASVHSNSLFEISLCYELAKIYPQARPNTGKYASVFGKPLHSDISLNSISYTQQDFPFTAKTTEEVAFKDHVS